MQVRLIANLFCTVLASVFVRSESLPSSFFVADSRGLDALLAGMLAGSLAVYLECLDVRWLYLATSLAREVAGVISGPIIPQDYLPTAWPTFV